MSINTSDTTEFIDALQTLLKRHGINKWKDLAEIIGIKPSTVSRNIGRLSISKDFNSGFGKNLKEKIGLTKEEINVLLEQFNSTKEKFINLEKRYRNRFEEHVTKYRSEIYEIFDSLKEGDTYTLITSRIPNECFDTQFFDELRASIDRGVKFSYIYPDPEISKKFKQFDNYWPYRSHEYRGLGMDLSRLIEKLEKFYSSETIESLIRLKKVDHDPFLFHPFFRFILINKYDGLKVSDLSFVEINTNDEAEGFWVPLNRLQTQRLTDSISKIIVK